MWGLPQAPDSTRPSLKAPEARPTHKLLLGLHQKYAALLKISSEIYIKPIYQG